MGSEVFLVGLFGVCCAAALIYLLTANVEKPTPNGNDKPKKRE